jgi:hypothetical protein
MQVYVDPQGRGSLWFHGARQRLSWVLLAMSGARFFIGHEAIGFLSVLISAFLVALASLGSDVIRKTTETTLEKA